MAEELAAAVSEYSLEHNSSGRRSHGGSRLAMKLLTVSGHVASADRIARYSGQLELEAGLGEADIGSSNSALEIAVANIAAAAAAAAAVGVSDPAAGRRRTAVVETSVGTVVFAENAAFAVEGVGSSAAVETVQIVDYSCTQAEHVVATDSVGFADVADFAVQVGSRRKARPRVAAAAGSTSAAGRTPNIAHSHLADRLRMEAAYLRFFYPVRPLIISLPYISPPAVASLTLTRR
jgi:hypothetical protein